MQNELRFSLTDKNGFETFLTYSPSGWDESLINRMRNTTYYSVTEKFTTNLGFVKDGKDILKDIFYTDGYEGYCELIIEQLNNQTFQYVTIYTGLIDFSTFVDERDMVKVDVNEGSFWEMVKANEKTEYELNIEDYTEININATFPGLNENQNVVSELNNLLQGLCILGFREDTAVINIKSVDFYSNFTASYVTFPYLQPSFLVVKPVTNASIYINGTLTCSTITAAIALKIRIFVSIFNGTNTYHLIDEISFAAYGGATPIVQLISYDLALTGLAVGDWISVNTILTDSSNIPVSYTYNLAGDLYANLDYITQPDAKVIKALTPRIVFSELLKKMNGGVAVSYNTAFLSTISDYLITSGDAIRGLSGSKIKTSFSDFFNSLNSIFCLGFGYESNIAYLRLRDYFFNNVLISDIGEVSQLEVSVLKDWIYNTVKSGCEEQTYDDVNGKYEFNQFTSWTLPIKKVTKEYNLVTKYRTDLYGILFTALNFEGKTSVDGDGDNDTFIIHTKTVTGTTTFNRDFDITPLPVGFPDPTKIFNHKLTPKRNILRNSAFIKSFLYSNTADINFTSALKNQDLEIQANDESGIIKENDTITNAELSTAYFQPFVLSFSTAIKKDFNTIINANQNGYIQFTFNGVTLKGYIFEVSVNPGKSSEYTIKLISHVSNDLTQLI